MPRWGSRKMLPPAGPAGDVRALQPVHALVLARPLRPSACVSLTPEGCAWCGPSNNIMRIFDRLLEAAGIDRVDAQGRKLDVHALRHTMATRLARAGAPLVQAQQILGHSDPKLTARVYQHLEVEDLRAAIECIGTHPPHCEASSWLVLVIKRRPRLERHPGWSRSTTSA